jgi:hypothetical protein
MLSVKEKIINQLDRMTSEQQKKMLEFANGLTRSPGTPGDVLVALMEKIQIDPADLEEMSRAIEEECERIDLDGWDLPA